MEIKADRQTATIHQFPAGGRRKPAANARAWQQVEAAGRRQAAAPAVATVDCGSGWYHDAAITDVSVKS